MAYEHGHVGATYVGGQISTSFQLDYGGVVAGWLDTPNELVALYASELNVDKWKDFASETFPICFIVVPSFLALFICVFFFSVCSRIAESE